MVEIKEMIKNIKEKYSVDFHFKYVPSDQNPGDFVTRGISLEKFKQNFTLWTHGPEWLNSDSVVWPLSKLECLSSRNKDKVQTNIFQNSLSDLPSKPVISFNKYSKFSILVDNIEMIFRLRDKVKRLQGQDLDHNKDAKLYLYRIMQEESFSSEIQYLQNPQNKKAPELVRNLDLF